MARSVGVLASVRKIGWAQVEAIAEAAERRGRILGVRLPPQDDGDTEPWTAPPSRRREAPIVGDLPPTLDVVLGNQIYIPKQGLNPGLRNRLLRLAAFQTRVLQSAGDAGVDVQQAAGRRAPRTSLITSGCLAGAGDHHSSFSARRRNSSGTERTTREADP
jgi:hypothetical protein